MGGSAAHIAAALLATAAACSASSSGSAPPVVTGDDAAAAVTAPMPDLVVVPLGKASLDEFGWRRGPGRPGFRRALAAEKRGDMAGVVEGSRAALAADPGHLEAAWMLAVALANQGKVGDILAPLQVAAAGDWAKWGERSLDLPVLQPFRDSPAGQAWMRASERYRAALRDELAGSLVVIARTAPYRPPRGNGETRVDHRAELYAVDLDGGRWIRLTRTGGAVAADLPAPDRPWVAYLAYRTVVRARGGATSIRDLRVGVVDLTTGRTGREVTLRDVDEATVAWQSGRGDPELVVRVVPARGAGRGKSRPRGYAIDWRHGQRRAADARPLRGDAIRVRPFVAERRRLPVDGITADWDDAGTASAFRIDRSKKVVAPGRSMVDGHSLVWSADGTRLAFASAPDDACGEDAARAVTVYVAEAGSGRIKPVGTVSSVPAPVWIDGNRLAYVDGDAVRVVDAATGTELTRLAGGGGVATSALGETRTCPGGGTAPFAPAPPPPSGDDGDLDVEPGDEPADPDPGTGDADPAGGAGTPDPGTPDPAPGPAPGPAGTTRPSP